MAVATRPMRPFFRNLALWLLILLILLLVFQLFPGNEPVRHSVTYTDFLEAVEQGRVAEVTLQGREIFGIYTDRTAFKTFSPDDPELVQNLRSANVSIVAKPERESPWYMTILISWFPMLLLIGVWIFFMRQMQAGGGKAMSFGKSRARLLTQDEKKVSFADVAGIDEAKEEVEEIVEFLRNPKKFTKLGGRIPKGVLLMGPPGTGKTLLARAIAGEAGVPFFSISGSDFVEMFVGVGASRVRDLFIQGKKNAPCIIFIDEIDAVGRHRGAGLGGGHDEREQTLNQLLVEMDGFESNEGVILIAATNRPDVLDPALLRPGRFDRQVIIPRPDVKGRDGILRGAHQGRAPRRGRGPDRARPGHARVQRGRPGEPRERGRPGRRPAGPEPRCDMDRLRERQGQGADGGRAPQHGALRGRERRTPRTTRPGTRWWRWLVPNADPIYKVSIIPRGRALGVTQQLPIDERHTYSRDYLLDRIAVFLGGRAAEEIFLGAAHHRSRRRHRQGHGDRAPDGLQVGHERGPGAPDLRQGGRADLPGQGDLDPQELQRANGGAHRRRDQVHRRHPTWSVPEPAPDGEP